MLVSRCFRLCTLCCRVVNGSGRGRAAGGGGWRTVTGQTGVMYANWPAVVPTRLCHNDLYKRESVQRYVQLLMKEYRDLCDKLQHPHLSESDRKVLLKKHTELLPLAEVFGSIEQSLKDLQEVASLLQSEWSFYISCHQCQKSLAFSSHTCLQVQLAPKMKMNI